MEISPTLTPERKAEGKTAYNLSEDAHLLLEVIRLKKKKVKLV